MTAMTAWQRNTRARERYIVCWPDGTTECHLRRLNERCDEMTTYQRGDTVRHINGAPVTGTVINEDRHNGVHRVEVRWPTYPSAAPGHLLPHQARYPVNQLYRA